MSESDPGHAQIHAAFQDSAKRAVNAEGGDNWAEFAGWLAVDTGTGIAEFNQASVVGPGAERAIDAVARWYARRSTGFRLRLRVPGDEAVVEAALAAGYREERRMPAMVRALPIAGFVVEGLRLARVVDDEGIGAYLAARAEGDSLAPPDDEEAAFIAAVTRTGLFHYLVGFEGEEPVATAMAFDAGDLVLVNNVFVREEWRRRGLGAAMTAAAAGLVPGARLACLEATELGAPVYARMGFTTAFWYLRLAPPPA